MAPCRMTKNLIDELPAWERSADAGAWGDLSPEEARLWSAETWRAYDVVENFGDFRATPANQQVLLPLLLWRTLDALGTGLRLLGKAVGA